MKNKADLGGLSTDELVRRFIDIALRQYDCIMRCEVGPQKKLFTEMDAVTDELRSRRGDERRALFRLYRHPNRQVRLKAAIRTLAINDQPARRVLEEIARETFYPQAIDAGMTLQNLDRGIFKPT